MLVSCAHCGATIARAAPTCPQCGGPQWQPPPKRKTSAVTWFFAIFLGAPCLLSVFIGAWFSANPPPPKAAPPPSQRWVALQNEPASTTDGRRALIQKLLDRGIVHEVEYRSSGSTISVRPAFYSLSFDDKQAFVSAIATEAYRRSERADVARIVDSRTNKKVGSFSFAFGLDLE